MVFGHTMGTMKKLIVQLSWVMHPVSVSKGYMHTEFFFIIGFNTLLLQYNFFKQLQYNWGAWASTVECRDWDAPLCNIRKEKKVCTKCLLEFGF